MRIAVIIPVLAGVADDYARLCIKSLRSTTDWDIIVVSNGPGYKPDFRGLGVTTHLHTRDQGQCNAVNIGYQVVGLADYVMVSNDDMYYAPGWANNLHFDNLVFSPNLVEPTNNRGSAAPFLKFDGGYTLDEFNKQAVDDFIWDNVDPVPRLAHELVEESGFNLPFFIRADVFRAIAGYDNAYDPWSSNSDTDLQTKINLAGITPMRLRDVLVYHFSTKSGTFDADKQTFWQNNWDYFKDKWGFDRDSLGSDVWYNKNMLPKDGSEIKYKPEWAGKYAKSNN